MVDNAYDHSWLQTCRGGVCILFDTLLETVIKLFFFLLTDFCCVQISEVCVCVCVRSLFVSHTSSLQKGTAEAVHTTFAMRLDRSVCV